MAVSYLEYDLKQNIVVHVNVADDMRQVLVILN